MCKEFLRLPRPEERSNVGRVHVRFEPKPPDQPSMVLVRSDRQTVPARAQLISDRQMRLNVAAGPVAEQSDPHRVPTLAQVRGLGE